MSAGEADAALDQALALSHKLLAAAESGDAAAAAGLDAERLPLLESARLGMAVVGAEQRQMLDEITALNDRAIGQLTHRLRGLERDLDAAAAGRRALLAYSATRPLR
jgi:hypothetical protein